MSSDILEFYIDKEKRELINTINSAKYVSEEQKETMISVLEDADADMKAAREKKKREAERKRKKDDDDRWAYERGQAAHAASGGNLPHTDSPHIRH